MKTLHCVLCLMVMVTQEAFGAPPRNIDAEDGGDVEGDIIKRPDADGKFSMLEHEFYKWPNNIVYYKFADDLSSSHRDIFKQAMAAVQERLTTDDGICIEFKKATNKDSYYIYVQNGGGCAAGIGRWPSYETPVYMGKYCNQGNMMHELLHTLGLYHEQARNDRDLHVAIHIENVRPGYESNFEKAGQFVYDQGTRYDYDSIMHYNAKAFTKDGSDTISVPEGVTTVIGQRDHLSDCDVERIQVHYGCKAKIEICAKCEN